MALNPVMIAAMLLFFPLALSAISQLSAADILEAKVNCYDCGSTNYNLSGIKVEVKCEHVSKLASTDTEGYFKVELPSGSPLNCQAKLLGGPRQLYAKRENMVSKAVKSQHSTSYTLSTPLAVYISCPLVGGKCGGQNSYFGSTKTVDVPLPREWGFAPSSYYIPFFPIIGIP